MINAIFFRVVSVISEYGGAVLYYAGDAVASHWPAESDAETETALRAAIACGLAVKREVANLPDEGHALAMRCGVSMGDLWLLDVDTPGGRQEVFAGPSLHAVQRLGLAAMACGCRKRRRSGCPATSPASSAAQGCSCTRSVVEPTGPGQWRFHHAIISDAAYQSLVTDQARRLGTQSGRSDPGPQASAAMVGLFCDVPTQATAPPGRPGSIVHISAGDVQLLSVSVEAKNIAWLTEERSFSSE